MIFPTPVQQFLKSLHGVAWYILITLYIRPQRYAPCFIKNQDGLMNKKLFFTLILIFSTFLSFTNSAVAETTQNPFDDYVFNRAFTFNDGTCRNGGPYAKACCYQGWRYTNCNFLYDQFENGKCLKGFQSTKWRQCRSIPQTTRQAADKANTPSRPRNTYPLMRPTGSLPYAADLTACASYGRRKAGGANMCAKGVRHALACMARRRGHKVGNYHFHCGASAYHYKGCLEQKGFINDMNKCNTPGVVRVYKGITQWRRGSGGDYHGHIEFLGTDGYWHAGVSSSLPINQRLGSSRRQLKGCYVLKPGTY